ncbi:MAG: sulfatase [Candidatus Brocadiia bacterium]
MSQDGPNIVYVFTDQQSARAMSCVGRLQIETPAMDSLAEEGVRFDRAYCTYPLCTPSRASMFTGLMPHEVEIPYNGFPIAEERRQLELGHVLSDAGYECVYGGKWHIPEIAIPEGHGFRRICGFSDWDLADRCIDFLRESHEAPFFLVASYDNPHNICEWSRRQALPWGPIEDVPTEDCPNLPSNFPPPSYEPQALQQFRDSFPGSEFAPDEWRHYRHAYSRLVEKIDASLARILEVLKEEGLEEDTLVVFSSDHGDGMGCHQWNQKWTLYEESIRIPFLMRLPGQIESGLEVSKLVSNGLDFYPTVCDFAEVEPPGDIHGRSLRPLLEGDEPSDWRENLVVETQFAKGGGPYGRAVVGERYKYCMYSKGRYREQLIDLENDPGEMVNLAVESRYEEMVEDYRDVLRDWIRRTDDRFFAHYAHPDRLPPVPGEGYTD